MEQEAAQRLLLHLEAAGTGSDAGTPPQQPCQNTSTFLSALQLASSSGFYQEWHTPPYPYPYPPPEAYWGGAMGGVGTVGSVAEAVTPGSSTDSWEQSHEGQEWPATLVQTYWEETEPHLYPHHHQTKHSQDQKCKAERSDATDETGAKTYECEHCGKKFNWASSLRTHILTHTGGKTYSCDQCGKTFAWSSSLRTHILTHSGTRKFECEHCGKRFTWSSSLRTHSLAHTGPKPAKTFECHMCGKKFNWSSSLKTHLLTHTGTGEPQNSAR